MPIVRYQIKNEYGLADPELYESADKEDPEALLEGVAMAGLVGVLRQLGDLAEFAAEIFHNLHEEVMATAARGHALMLRVQQLEVDFPAIERVFPSHTVHSQLSYNAGVDWHPNLQIDQNLVTREDMPRFILDSYEESRGPPRLFMLDKFDVAGDGACLKRYSDPSFFKMDFASSGKMEPDIQREKKSRKHKKKGPRWRNGETPEAHTTQHANPKSEHMASGKAPENPPVKRVKLKARQLNDTTSVRRSYIEHIVEKQSPEHTHLPENSMSHSQVKMKTIDSTELVPDVHEVIMDTSIRKPFFRERNQRKPDMRDSQDEKKGLQEVTGEVERLPPPFNDQNKLFDADYKREGNDDAESRTNGSLDGYRSDDAASELDNYLDALTTMDSEIETDNETKTKPAPNFFSKEYNKTDSNANEGRELLDECLGSHMFKESSAQNSLSNKRVSSPNVDLSNGLADSTPAHGTSRSLPGMCLDPETLAGETNGIHFEGKANSELLGKDSPIDLVPKQVTPDISIPLSESGVESSGFCTADTTATPNYTSLHASPEDIQSAAANQNTLSSHIDSTERRDVCFDSESSPPVNLDALGTAEDTNVTLSNLVVGDGEANKILKDDLHQRPDESKIPSIMEEDYANPGPVSKNTENFSDALWQLGDQSDLNLQIQDDPSRETQIALPGTEEPNAEVIMSMPTVSDLTQMPKATNLEITSPLCIEDSPLPLSMFNEELHGSVCQVPEVDSGESTLPGKCPPVLPLDDGSTSFVLDGLCGPIHDSVLSNEKVECARLLTCLEDAADFSENKVSSPENTGNFAENEVITSGILLPEASFDMKVPQESCNLDQMEFAQNGELVPQESCNLGQVEFTQRDELDDIPKVPPNVSNYETNDSFLVSETRDSPLPTGDNQNLISTPPFSSPVESLPAEGCSSHSVTECTETDELDSAIVHSKESSSNKTNLHEDHFSSDSVSEQQRLEVKEASYLRGLIESGVQLVPGAVAYEEEYVVVTASQDSVSAGCVLDSSCQPDSGVQQVPDTVASQEEYFVISGPQDSVSAGCVLDSSSQPESGVQQVPGTVACLEDYVAVSSLQDSVSAGYVLDSSSQPDSGENSHVCTEPFELAQEDLYPSDGSRAAISSVEEEGGKLLSPILQNESNSINSVVEHYLGNVKVSNSEDLIAPDVQQASKVAFPGQEESDAATGPRGSKSAESTHDSLDHVDMKPVPCQEDSKMVASPQNSGTEERLLESSNMSDIDLAKHAEGNMDPLEANELIGRPLESQQVSHSKPLALCKPCLAANGDISLSDNVITEIISPSKEVSALQYSNESDENSLPQKFESLNLSNNQFERQQSHELEDNSLTTEIQLSVPQAAQDSVEVVSSGKIYELDKTSANVASSNLVETEVDYPLQPNHGIPASSAISSASLASLPTFPSLGASSTLMIQQQSSKLPLDGDPPLPPLPPLQWRMGKLRPSSVMINDETTMPESGLNNLTTLPSLDHSGDSLGMGGVAVQPSNPFLQVQMHPNDSGWFGYQGLEEERMNPFQSNALPPAMEGQKFPDDLLASDIQMKHLPAISSSVVSQAEDDRQKNEFCQGALSGDVPQSLNPFTSPLELSDLRSQHFERVSECESVEPPESSASQPTFVDTESLHDAANLETGAIHPFNPFLSSTPTEGEDHQYDDREFESRTGHHLDCPDPLSTADVAPQGFLISQGGNMQSFEGVTLPTAEHGQPNGKPRSLLNRPRDPLIEAVASHDKSTLRRVSELVRPSATPEGERNTLLEQIRNKSFNLKPATVAKPDIKGPQTNLKVAAILERANAIRQAFAGSDEDDDGESWSDS